MRAFQQVDVFSSELLLGNPVAVVHDAEGLTTEQMERFTRWTNLSEATFLLPATEPGADYRVRIFTPAGELPFAGHPTLGTCHAWLAAGGRARDPDRIVQQCPAGLVPIRRVGDTLAFQAPPVIRSGPVAPDELARITRILRLGREDIVASQWVDNGPGWVAVMLASAEDVLELHLAGDGRQLDLGVVGLYPEGSEFAYEVRAFFTDDHGEIREDPVTGSLNASVAQWLIGNGTVVPPYTASQGTAMGRAGRPRISTGDDGSIWVAGATRTIVEGSVEVG
ncbi:MAG: PhzF family phenazine biosynthesis protein [Chloroflexota bacterium]|jgi:PhzF family phenazine biosynthesis protein